MAAAAVKRRGCCGSGILWTGLTCCTAAVLAGVVLWMVKSSAAVESTQEILSWEPLRQSSVSGEAITLLAGLRAATASIMAIGLATLAGSLFIEACNSSTVCLTGARATRHRVAGAAAALLWLGALTTIVCAAAVAAWLGAAWMCNSLLQNLHTCESSALMAPMPCM